MTHKHLYAMLLAIMCCLCAQNLHAQDEYGSFLERPKALGITLGSQGVGLDFTQSVATGVSFRIGGSYLPVSYKYSGVFSQVDSDVKLKAKNFANAHLMVDFYPSMDLGLRITPGIGYFFNAEANATVQPSGNYKYGDISLTGAQLGQMNGTIKWKGVAPFLGAGWLFYFREGESPITLGVDVGSYYLPKPESTLTGTNLFQYNSYNEERFKENTKNYRWLPLLQVTLRYSFFPSY